MLVRANGKRQDTLCRYCRALSDYFVFYQPSLADPSTDKTVLIIPRLYSSALMCRPMRACAAKIGNAGHGKMISGHKGCDHRNMKVVAVTLQMNTDRHDSHHHSLTSRHLDLFCTRTLDMSCPAWKKFPTSLFPGFVGNLLSCLGPEIVIPQ